MGEVWIPHLVHLEGGPADGAIDEVGVAATELHEPWPDVLYVRPCRDCGGRGVKPSGRPCSGWEVDGEQRAGDELYRLRLEDGRSVFYRWGFPGTGIVSRAWQELSTYEEVTA